MWFHRTTSNQISLRTFFKGLFEKNGLSQQTKSKRDIRQAIAETDPHLSESVMEKLIVELFQYFV